MPRGRKKVVRTTQVVEEPQGIVSFLKRYESEISSFLGIVVALALAGILLFLIRRSLPNPSLVPGSETSAPTEQTEQQQPNGSKYTVKNGQGLWQVSQDAYGDGHKWRAIAQANQLQAPYTLKSGQELVIPVPAVDVEATAIPSATATAAPAVEPTTQPSEAPIASPAPSSTEPAKPVTTVVPGSTYTVKKGDYLWRIAIAAYGDGYKWTKIYEANKDKIKTPGYIEIGWELTIPQLE